MAPAAELLVEVKLIIKELVIRSWDTEILRAVRLDAAVNIYHCPCATSHKHVPSYPHVNLILGNNPVLLCAHDNVTLYSRV